MSSDDAEIIKLTKTLEEIQNLDLDKLALTKRRKYFWEHELGWLDYYFEILMIKGELPDDFFRRVQEKSKGS